MLPSSSDHLVAAKSLRQRSVAVVDFVRAPKWRLATAEKPSTTRVVSVEFVMILPPLL